MVKSVLFINVGKTALLATLASGTALMAQELPTVAAPETAPAVVQTPAAEVVAPPPAVRTLPSANDVVNAAAAEQAAAERKPAAATAPRPERKNTAARTVSTSASSNATLPASPPPAPATPTFNEPASALPTEAPVAAPATSDDVATTATPFAPADGASNEDLTLFAGIAAALAALGLGGLLASRRRRNVAPQSGYLPVSASAPAPAREVQPAFEAVAQPAVVDRPLVRKAAMRRPDIPVTDPLFSTPVHAAPVTDPLFAPRNDVEIPITDPLFAKNARFNGRMREEHSSMVREPVT